MEALARPVGKERRNATLPQRLLKLFQRIAPVERKSMINSPPRRRRRGPDRFDAGRATAVDHQPTVKCAGGRLTAPEFSVGLGNDQRGPQERPEILSHVGGSLRGRGGEQLFGPVRSREYEHAVQTRA